MWIKSKYYFIVTENMVPYFLSYYINLHNLVYKSCAMDWSTNLSIPPHHPPQKTLPNIKPSDEAWYLDLDWSKLHCGAKIPTLNKNWHPLSKKLQYPITRKWKSWKFTSLIPKWKLCLHSNQLVRSSDVMSENECYVILQMKRENPCNS